MKMNNEYLFLLHYYREFCEFELPVKLGGKSYDCKEGVYFD